MATYVKDEDIKKNQIAEPTTKLNGVDEATQDKISNPNFTASGTQKIAQNTANEAKDRVQEVTSNKQIVGDNVWNTLNSSFTVPDSVKQADTYIASQLQKIQSGKTSYSDQVKDMIAQIQGREKFSYDVDSDPLFQQALSSAMSSGKQAMQDTIGQASALTGGYGSTYATTAGNQAYNAFIEDAYNNLPEYYQMAMEAYQMEGDDMYRQLDMLNSADDKEYNRNITAYDATYQHRNQMYNESYQLFRDSKTDAMNMANLQLSEHGQLVSDAVNNYNVSSDYANTLYGREYQEWSDTINQAMQYAQMLNTNWWNTTNFNEGVREYEQNYAQTEHWNQEEMDYKKDALNKEYTYKDKQFNLSEKEYMLSTGDTDKDGVLSDEEYAKYVERYGSKNGNEKTYPKYVTDRLATMTSKEEMANYIAGLEEAGVIDDGDALLAQYAPSPLISRNWTMVYDGGNNGSGDIDEDARVKDERGNEIRLDDLYDALIKEGQTEADAKAYILKLQRSLGITKD